MNTFPASYMYLLQAVSVSETQRKALLLLAKQSVHLARKVKLYEKIHNPFRKMHLKT